MPEPKKILDQASFGRFKHIKGVEIVGFYFRSRNAMDAAALIVPI
jgi:hypothetical protein